VAGQGNDEVRPFPLRYILRVAITGVTGLFGSGLVEIFSARHTVLPLTRADADITKGDEVRRVLCGLRPDVVVHPAAIPDPDVCEADPEKAFLVNVEGTRHVVESARELGAAVVQISTDAVYDGKKQAPYLESDPINPPSVYGNTKAQADLIVQTLPRYWIFRVPVLFGPGKTNFVEKGLRKLAAGEEYTVASDQIGNSLYTLDGARTIMGVVESGPCGIYHLTNQGACSRLDLARCAAEFVGGDSSQIIGKPADMMGRLAPRLKYSVLEMGALKRAGIAPPRPWKEALAEYIHSRPPSL
jgi:dTDP-4-dehydrorhamnose reductase